MTAKKTMGASRISSLGTGLLRALPLLAFVAAAAAVATLVVSRVQRHAGVIEEGRSALDALLVDLRARGYTIDPALSGKYAPGTVIQTHETTSSGGLKPLSPPLVFLWPDKCFPGIQPRSSSYAIKETTGTSTLTVSASGEQVARWLPKFALGAEGLAKYGLSLVNPHTLVHAKGDLSEHFAPECVQAFAAELTREKAESFRIVLDAVVVDEVHYDIEWGSNLSAEARAAITREAEQSLKVDKPNGVVEVRVNDQTSHTTRISGKGQFVLGYIARPLDPVRSPSSPPSSTAPGR